MTIPETAALRRKISGALRREVQLVLDPRVTAEEDTTTPRGVIIGASSVTDMLAFWQSEEEYVDTLRRRERFEWDGQQGWLVSYEIADLMDVVPA